jgi:primosomal protein N' (replication factor Y)
VESYYRAERGRYTLLKLPARFPRGGTAGEERALPPVDVIDMRGELRRGNTSIFSESLATALRGTLGRGEQALLFLNRRGAATCVSCRDCGHVMTCRRCDAPLVFHRADEQLVCHRCNRRRTAPTQCPGCGGARIRYFGLGTQRVEAELRAQFADARVIRWDRDSTTRRDAHEKLWRAFGAGEADVMVGTQMIAKALDFPRVTLVGVVLADVGLFLPDLRAGERSFQLLSQMAGRTGRGPLGGRAIIQTYAPEHYAIQAAATHDFEGFYKREMAFRRVHGYPPLGRLVRLVYTGHGEERCVRETATARRVLDEELERQGIADIQVIGPAPCYVRRVRGRERWQIVLRGDRFARVLDRLTPRPGWVIDVDPVSLL